MDDSKFKELIVYQKAYGIVKEIYQLQFKYKDKGYYSIYDQISRASLSVALNIAEGHGRQSESKDDFKRFLRMSLGSCNEVLVLVELSNDLGVITNQEHTMYTGVYMEIKKMLHTMIMKL